MLVGSQDNAYPPLDVRDAAVKDVLPARLKSGNASRIVSVPFSLIKVGELSTDKATRITAIMVLGASKFRAFAPNVNIRDLKRDIATWSGDKPLCIRKVAALPFLPQPVSFTLFSRSLVPLSDFFISVQSIRVSPGSFLCYPTSGNREGQG